MADVTIKYKDNTIAELSDSGNKTLATSGKYCEGDIVVEYVAKATGLENVKRWDVTTTGIPASGFSLNLVTDPWLAENRDNEGLCVLVLPKFTITADATKSVQGIHLASNRAFYKDSTKTYYSMYSRLPINADGTYNYSRHVILNNGGNGCDIGDMYITAAGTLIAIATDSLPFAAGDYVVYAFII